MHILVRWLTYVQTRINKRHNNIQCCRESFAAKACNFRSQSQSTIDSDDIILRAKRLDVLVEFDRQAELIQMRAEGEGSVVCEGYGLIPGTYTCHY